MKNFKDFYNKLEHATAEEIIKSMGFNKVDVYDHVVTDNEDGAIEEFLKSINTEIEDYGVGYCLLSSEGKWYEVPYVAPEKPDNAMALIFLFNKIYDVTDSYE